MRERRIIYLLFLIAAVGVIITFCNSQFLTGKGTGYSESAQTAGTAGGGGRAGGESGGRAGGSEALPDTAGEGAVTLETVAESRADTEADAAVAEEAAVSEESEGELEPAAAALEAAADSVGVEGDQPRSVQMEPEQKIAVLEQKEDVPATVAISPLETAAVNLPEQGAGSQAEDLSEDNPYRRRLQELDTRIQKNRENRNSSGGRNASGGSSAAKNQASDELWLWDSELNSIYSELLKRLGDEQAESLVTSQREWLRTRDAQAVEAAKNSAGGSRESVDYTSSLAESTRTRAYELVSLYGSVLME